MQHAERDRKPLLPLDGRAREPRSASPSTTCPPPPFTGAAPRRARRSRRCAVHRLAVLLPRVGAEGQVPVDPRAAGGARALRRRARAARARSSRGRPAAARGVYGFWPAAAKVTTSSSRTGRGSASSASSPTMATRGRTAASPTTSRPAGDALGAFAVGIHGADELAAGFEAEHDDYNAIMDKALADRLAEAFAEWLHAEARRAWYAPGEELSSEELVDGALPRDPAGVRLPRLPGPQREGEALRPARRRRGRARADRDLRDDPGRERQRHLLRAPRGAVLLGRPHRPRPGRGLRRPQGNRVDEAERWLRPNLAYEPETAPVA